MTLKELAERMEETHKAMADNLARELYGDREYEKPSAWQAFKYKVVSRVKAAVRWATYWAWEDHI